MKKNLISAVTLLIVPLLILTQPAVKAQDGPRGRIERKTAVDHHRTKFRHVIDMLRLTDQQKADLKTINLKYQRLNIPLRSDLRLVNLDLREAIESLDQKKIDEAIKKINNIKAELFKHRIEQQVEFHKLLTDEQRKMLRDRPYIPHRMEWGQMMENPGGPGNMDRMDPEFDFSYGFGSDLPLYMYNDELEMEPENQ